MRKILCYITTVTLSLLLGSCSLDNDDANFEFSYLKILDVEIPETFDFNAIYKIKVTYLRPDECDYFHAFDVIKVDETTREVVIIGSTLTDQVECPTVNQEIETSFDFQVLYTGTYLFKFWTGEDTNGNQQFLEIEVPVN